MNIATWNVNSFIVRFLYVLDWLAANQPDVLCLQETKLQAENFPVAEIAASGYQTIYTGQRTYNGVAVLSKRPGIELVTGIPGLDDPQKRVLSAIYDDVRVICIYVPNGEKVGSEKYEYKLRWLAALKDWIREVLNLGLLDSFRLFEQPEKSYTWWDYRMMAFRRNMGLRIDHILLSSELAKTCTACVIDKTPRKLERPSDHAPIMVELGK